MKKENRHKRPGAPDEREVEASRDDGSRPMNQSVDTSCKHAYRKPFLAAETREIMDLAWPICAAMLGETVIGIVDTFLVAGLGKAAIGGVGLAIIFMFLSYSFVYGLMRAVKIRTSHAVGEGRRDLSFSFLLSGVLLGLAAGVGVFIFGRDASWLFTLTRADPEIVPYAKDFLAAITWGAPATCAFAALIQHRQAMGDSRSPMILQLTGNVFHGFLGYGLIYGKFGLPALGASGAGYATSMTEVLLFVSLGALAVRDGRRYFVPALARLREATWEVLQTGLPTGLQFAIEVFAFTAFTSILGSIASTEIAAHQIALNVIRASFLPGIAISEAACVLVGQSLGKGDPGRVPRIARSALRLGMGFMAFCGLCFALFGPAIARAFTSDVDVLRVATRLLYIAAAFQVLDAVSIVLRGVLRGAKDATFVAICGVSVALLTIPTFAYVLGKQMGMGAVGGWLGFIAETTLNATLLYVRLRRTRFVSSAPALATKNDPKGEEQAAEAA